MFSFGHCPNYLITADISHNRYKTSGDVLIQAGVLLIIGNSEFWPFSHVIYGQLKSQSTVCRGKVSVSDTWDQVFWPRHPNPLTCIPEKLDCTSWRRPLRMLNNIIQKSTKNIQISCSCCLWFNLSTSCSYAANIYYYGCNWSAPDAAGLHCI